MKLKINTFPPIIQKCEIDLSKKVTLFVGKNNAGKTYISQLVWAINDFDPSIDEYLRYADYEPCILMNDTIENSSKVTIDENIIDIISRNYTKFLLKDNLEPIFKKKMEADIDVVFNLDDIRNKEISNMIQGSEWKLYYTKEKGNLEFNVKISFNNSVLTQDKDLFPADIVNRYLEGILIYNMINYNAVYMPSTRLFLPSFYKYIFTLEKDLKDTMLDNFDILNKKNKNFFASSYTLPVEKLMNKLVFEMDELSSNEYLEKLTALIDGTISINKAEDIGMADISYVHKSGTNLPMFLSSSMVNQLATIYLYFKYWYKDKNNFLILDEPEMNLHPSKKMELTELLLAYASDNKLLIATHSSSIAKSIINYIHLFDLKEKLTPDAINKFILENELSINPNIDLVSNDMAVYYFNGKTIVSYKKDDDSHMHFGTFTDIEKLQNKQYEYIMEKLENEA